MNFSFSNTKTHYKTLYLNKHNGSKITRCALLIVVADLVNHTEQVIQSNFDAVNDLVCSNTHASKATSFVLYWYYSRNNLLRSYF